MATLKKQISIQGHGLMSGIDSSVEIFPSDKKGIRFFVNNTEIPAKAENVVSTQNCTVLAKDSSSIMLIEHFMATCAFCNVDSLDVFCNVDSLDVCVSAQEMPILDGSAKGWYEAFCEAGITDEEQEPLTIKEPINFRHNSSLVSVIPSDSLNISQRWVNFTKDTDKTEIIEARTFGYLKDLEKIQAMGLAKGVSIDNTVGLTEDGYTTELRSLYEPAKHKILDLIGDFMLTGFNPLSMNAMIIAKEAGHFLHVETAKLMNNLIVTKEKI